MTDRYRLHYFPDNASLVIRLVLEHIGVAYDTVLVDRMTGAQKSAAYLEVNPAGLIPTLETPDGPIFETAAILLWLADRHGQMAPYPDSTERGAFLKHLFFTSNTLHVAARMRFYPNQYLGDAREAYGTLRTQMATALQRHLDLLEATAATQPSWLGGSDLSILDVYIACICRWIALYPTGEDKSWCDLKKWPHLYDMAVRLEHRPCAVSATKTEGLGTTPFTNPALRSRSKAPPDP